MQITPQIIIPVTKGPHPKGRFGPKEKQDWYRSLAKAVTIARKRKSGILIISAMKIIGEEGEADTYRAALLEMGLEETADFSVMLGDCSDGKFIIIRECCETIGQMEEIALLARNFGFMPVFVSTLLHYLRVRWLAWGIRSEHYCSFKGRPRPREAITDLILTMAFPILDLLGLREWFQGCITKHRAGGKF